MKNLFKKLMLVAVAAMAFTACSQDVNEVNKVEKVTRYEFTANIADDTRSGFAEKEEGATAYKSEWYGDETLKVCANGAFASAQTIKVEDAEGHFTVEFTGDNVPSMIDVYSPASAWNSENYPTIPAVQTPGAHSVDPAAHILKAQAASVESGVVTLQHMVAYGKMTVNAPDFAISKVEVSLVGLPNQYWSENQTYTYVINATNVQNNTFWFATEAMQIVKEFTVTAYNEAGNSVSKTVSGLTEGQLGFTAGRVSTFSVSGLEAAAEPSVPVFTSAYVYDYGNGYNDYYLIFEDAVLGELVLNAYYVTNSDWTIPAGVYGFGGSYGYFYYGQYSTYNDIQLYDGTVEIAVVDGEYVFTLSNLKNGNGNIVLESAIYTGIPDGLAVPDMRTALAKPNVTATAQGNIVTLSWDAVTGADEYYVFCASSSSIAPITTTEKTVTIEAAYDTTYQFMVTAVASDTNPDYKSSEATYVDVKTEKDPNGPIAEYMATELKWDSAGYFVFVTDHYEIFRVKMNDSDCPDHKTIKEGNYTAVASSTVPAGKFSVYQKVIGGSSEGWTSTKTTSTMSVKYVDGEYVIVVNYIGAWGGNGEVGYKGVPEGWVVPTAGDSGDSGDEGGSGDGGDSGDVNELGSESNPYTFTSVAKGEWTIEFTGAENGDRIVMDCNTTNVDAWISDHGANTWIPMTKLLYGSGASIYGYNGTDYTNSAFWSYSFVKVVKSGSTYTFTFKLGISNSTHAYYTYTGAI